MTTQRDDYVSPAEEMGLLLAPLLAEEIRALVARHQVKQWQIVELLGVAQSGVSARMNGHQPFALEEIVTLAHFFEISPTALLGAASARLPEDEVARIMGRDARTERENPRRSAPGGGSLFVSDFGTASGTRTPNPLIKSQVLSLDAARRRLRAGTPERRSA